MMKRILFTTSILFLAVPLFLTCGPSTSPFTPANATISIMLVNSRDIRNETTISDTVGSTIYLGVSAYLFKYITTVSIFVGKSATDTDTVLTLGSFSSGTDTLWLNINLKAAGSHTVTATATIPGAPNYTATATIVIFALPHTVAYDGNGNTSGVPPQDANTYSVGAAVTVKANSGNLARTGFTFAGWDTATTGAGTAYSGGETFFMPDKKVTLYAKWTRNPTYSVMYSGNGSTAGTAPVDVNAYDQGADVTVKANTGSLGRTNYTFEGWNTKSDGTGATYSAGTSLTIGTSNDTLFATWVLNPPKVANNPANLSVVAGQTATFAMTASGDSLRYQWLKGGVPISGATVATYTTPVATLADSGSLFRCIVSNAAGMDTSAAATLTVTTLVIAPLIKTEPAKQTVVEGTAATFTVVASGTSPLYQWQKGASDIANATSSSYTTSATTPSDSGSVFRCIVSNQAGSDTSTGAVLAVLRLPSAPVISGITIGDASAVLSWGPISGATSYNLYYSPGTTVDKSTGTKIAGAVSPATVASLTNETKYAFAVSTVNVNGESALSAAQTATPQVPAPAAPTIGSAISGNARVTVSWNTVTGAASYILYYATGTSVDKTGTKVTGATSPNDVTGLTNGTLYAFAVSAVNPGGESALSAIQTATPQIPTPGAPTLGTVTAGNAKATVSWNSVTGASSYNLYYAAGTTVDKSGTKVTGATSPADVTSLTNGTQYTFAVSAINAGGESGLSAAQTVTPQVPIPAAPVLSAVSTDNTKATVTWAAVNGAMSYYLYYALGTTVDKTGTRITAGTSPADVPGLTTGVTFAFAVSAVNAGGESGLSNVKTAMLRTYASITAGDGCSMAIKSNGTQWVTGSNFDGQLGDGTTTDRSSFYQIMSGVSTVAAGQTYTLILKKDETLWGTGGNEIGQLGNSSTSNLHAPAQVMTGVQAVTAGSGHTLFLKADGSLWAVGANNDGQLCDGSTTNQATPEQLLITGVSAISAGLLHTMILKNNGSLWAAGANFFGQLGDGTDTNRGTPVHIMDGVAAVSAGQYHTMILKTDGTLWGTGNNSYGQLGDTMGSRSSPVQIMSGVSQVSAGGGHNMILKTDGTLWANGSNSNGQLGDGTTIDRSTPKQVMTNVSAVSAGMYHTMILKNDGTLYTVGRNDQGALGDGSTADKSTPVYIP
jgi:uncharacterized repeat protein (TIGR02543 family)